MQPRLSAIHVYPIKSCAALTPDQAWVEPRGLVGDRRWMVVDAVGDFVTARKHPKLVLIRSHAVGDGLMLDAPNMPRCSVAVANDHSRIAARVWHSHVQALTANKDADAWISEYLGFAARFVYMDAQCSRAVDAEFSSFGDEVSFADGYPLLLISRSSLDTLNDKLSAPVPMQRFRPNLVVDGTAAHAEDGWRSIRIGEVRFDLVKLCSRCVLTTVDPERGEFDLSGEPLRTLMGYRRSAQGVTFGQNLIPRDVGNIRIGDKVEILE